MSTNTRHPGSLQINGLGSMIEEIVRIAAPEKIHLIGASYEYLLTENIFIKNPIKELKNCRYNLLILSDSKGRKSLTEMESILNLKLCRHGSLHLRLMDIHDFNTAVKTGSEFENFILLNAMVCYDNGKILTSDPVRLNA